MKYLFLSVQEKSSSFSSTKKMRGFPLYLARLGWLLLAFCILIHLIVSIPLLAQNGAGLCPGSCAGSLRILQTLGLSLQAITIYLLILSSLFTLTCLGLSGLIMRYASQERMALYTAFMLTSFGGTAFEKVDLLFAFPGWRVVVLTIACVGQSLFFIFFLVFPGGSFVPRWTRMLAWIFSVLCSAYYLIFYTAESLHIQLSFVVTLLLVLCGIPLFACALFAQIYRFRVVSSAAERRQSGQVLAALLLAILLYLVLGVLRPLASGDGGFFFDLLANTLINLALLAIPLSIGLAVLRNRLWEINLVLNRALVYAALTTLVFAIYVLIVGSLALIFREGSNVLVNLGATGCVALLFQPLRSFLQRGVNRLMYGERDDPAVVIARLGRSLEATLAPEAMPQAIVETVAQALKLPYAALYIKHGDSESLAAAYGGSKEHPLFHLPLSVQGEKVGELRLEVRGPEETFSAADKRLLQDFAYQAGLAVRAIRLNRELQHSREQLVLAREEERRRIRRDLHDGLAPTLAALALSAGALGEMIAVKPARAVVFTQEIEKGLREAIGDIRHLVYDLRPPTLDELGLLAALREFVERHTLERKQEPLQVRLELPEEVLQLPAALEVAALRIVQEAFMNVLRHAKAEHCLIRLTLTDSLQIEVRDDGIGIADKHRHGVGLLSMRERAAELGGVCIVERVEPIGTCIRVRLPIPTKEE